MKQDGLEAQVVTIEEDPSQESSISSAPSEKPDSGARANTSKSMEEER